MIYCKRYLTTGHKRKEYKEFYDYSKSNRLGILIGWKSYNWIWLFVVSDNILTVWNNFCLLRAQIAMSKREGELPAVTDGECVTKRNN